MGLTNGVFWMAWFIDSFIIMTFSSAVLTFILTVIVVPSRKLNNWLTIYSNSYRIYILWSNKANKFVKCLYLLQYGNLLIFADPSLIFVFLVSYTISVTFLSFFFSTVFRYEYNYKYGTKSLDASYFFPIND